MRILSLLKKIIYFPTNTLFIIINFFLLKTTNSHYKSFPKINGKIVRSGSGQLILGRNIKINSNWTVNPVGLGNRAMFYVGPRAKIIIGDNTGISTSLLFAYDNITIEDNVLIGGGCQILDSDFHSISYENRVLHGDSIVKSKPILIRQGAFIGTSSIILKGVIVGEKSVIAAGSVVTKSVPSNEIWGGNPAKFIRNLI